ncbi:hypothetical protein BO94DRAFT_268736 [Aspergillus sclerotioniger CBS 115572]|uniref:Amino acid permease/ SLC12A domain-containing protein n=1 Tax=Aspergillus sclerotioniger CBS 115572 TaxID=1450535 RepID=A0A317V819_9EURO|nr:hypothetical protein BO94DRAFT_268736 [Aspergillus sclerotioniger CBS 115572]PWY70286.1 hypothetical protein BO94DRAFT_268736 [Aspergillus sclerotioniger CBS 115572]
MGLLLATLIMSVVVVAVNECFAELSQRFPIYNAIAEYVRTFLDEELGWVVGLAYWYAYAAAFATQNMTAGMLLEYWGLSKAWRALICYGLVPIALFLLNAMGVFYYGLVGTFGGCLKLIMIIAISIYLYVIAGDSAVKIPSLSFSHSDEYASKAQAGCYALTIITYAFQGIEIYAMAAYEAWDDNSLGWASQYTVYVVVVVYIMCTVGEVLTVDRNSIFPDLDADRKRGQSSSMVIIAALNAKDKRLAGFLNGCLFFSVLSAANTSLYVASRTLYGMADKMPRNWITRSLSTVSKKNQVPVAALLVSMLSFYWVPFLRLKDCYVAEQITEVISFTCSNAIMIVWAAVCGAFIRYHRWMKHYSEGLPTRQRRTPRGPLASLQPLQAWLGLITCIVVFAFSSAPWWNDNATVGKVAEAYGTHIVSVTLFLLLKVKKAFNSEEKLFIPAANLARLTEELDDLEIRRINHAGTTRLEQWMTGLVGRVRRRSTVNPDDDRGLENTDFHADLLMVQTQPALTSGTLATGVAVEMRS